MNSKIFICGITSNKNQNNIAAICDYIDYVDGLIFDYNMPANYSYEDLDNGYHMLKEVCDEGHISLSEWTENHSHHMNNYLFSSKINIGDWIIQLDSLERLGDVFLRDIRDLVQIFEDKNINTIYNHSKLFMFRRFPQQFFVGTPHWGLQGSREHRLDLAKETGEGKLFLKEEDYYYSERNNNRNKFQFIDHYLKYYLYQDSNHLLLGLENNPDRDTIYQQREIERYRFLQFLIDHGIDKSVEGVKLYVKDNWEKDEKLRFFLATNKILNDFYNYHILESEDIIDDHDWNKLVEVK